MMVFAKSVAVKLKAAIPCNRIGVSVIGLEVPHAHIHLVLMDSLNDICVEFWSRSRFCLKRRLLDLDHYFEALHSPH